MDGVSLRHNSNVSRSDYLSSIFFVFFYLSLERGKNTGAETAS